MSRHLGKAHAHTTLYAEARERPLPLLFILMRSSDLEDSLLPLQPLLSRPRSMARAIRGAGLESDPVRSA